MSKEKYSHESAIFSLEADIENAEYLIRQNKIRETQVTNELKNIQENISSFNKRISQIKYSINQLKIN